MSIFSSLVKGSPQAISRRIVSIVTFIIGQVLLYWVYEKTGYISLFLDFIIRVDEEMETLIHVSTGMGIFGLIVMEIDYSRLEFDDEADTYLTILRFAYNTLSLLFPFGAGIAYGWIGIISICYWCISLYIDWGDSLFLLCILFIFVVGGFLMSCRLDWSDTLSILVEKWELEDSWLIKDFMIKAIGFGSVGTFILWKWSGWAKDEFLIKEKDRGILLAFFALFSLLGGMHFFLLYILLGFIFCIIGFKSEDAAHIYLIVMLIVLGIALAAIYGTACYYRYEQYGWNDFSWYRLLRALGVIKSA